MACPKNLVYAYEMLMTKMALTNTDIKQIFGVKANSCLIPIKKPVLAAMAEKGLWTPRGSIHTATAFEVWGLDEKDLERKYAKAKKYGMLKGVV